MGDMSESIVPRSDQLNAEDLLSGPRTVTITDVRVTANPDQPVSVYTEEFGRGRPFKPSKTVRRLMVVAWGEESAAYVGQRMTLYRDPAVKFGGMDVGGIRVSHMSGLDGPLSVALTVTRGRRGLYTVDQLPAGESQQQGSRGPFADRAAGMVAAFGGMGVSEEDIARRIGRPPAGWSDADLDRMKEVWTAMHAGTLSRDEAFPRSTVTVDDLPPDPGPPDADYVEVAALLDRLGVMAVTDRLALASLYVTHPVHVLSALNDRDRETVVAALETIARQDEEGRAADLARDLTEARQLAAERDPRPQ